MAETAESIMIRLISLAGDLRLGDPVETILDELEDAITEWREEFPCISDNTKGKTSCSL